MLLFRPNDDLFVPHAVYEYRRQRFSLDKNDLRRLQQQSPNYKYVAFLQFIGRVFVSHNLRIILDFELSFPPRVTVSDYNNLQLSVAGPLSQFMSHFLESEYRLFNGGSLLIDICPTFITSGSDRLFSEMQQLTDAYFVFEFPNLGRPVDLSI